MEAKHVMKRALGRVPADMPLLDAVREISKRSALVVFKRNKPCGLVTRNDLACGVIRTNRPNEAMVRHVMSTRVERCHEDTDLSRVRALVNDEKTDHLFVFDGQERLVGVVSESDV